MAFIHGKVSGADIAKEKSCATTRPVRWLLTRSVNLIAWVMALLLVSTPLRAQEAPESPAKIFASLAADIQRIGKNTDASSEYKAAKNAARQRLKTLIEKNPDADLLVERNSAGITPLMFASAYGFSGLVEELLGSERIKAGLNEVGPNQTTAWMFANFLFRSSLWSCRPQILNDPFLWVPLFESQGYYLYDGDQDPYQLTRRALEKAGAKADLAGAKAAWLERCPNSEEVTKVKVRESNDLIPTLREDGRLRLALHQAKLEVAAAAAAPLKPKRDDPPLQEVELPVDFLMVAPPASYGPVATRLSGWWSMNFIFSETLIAFEKFNSDTEVSVVLVNRSGKGRPYKSRRFNMTLADNTVTGQLGNDAKITITVSTEGRAEAFVESPKFTSRLMLRKYEP